MPRKNATGIHINMRWVIFSSYFAAVTEKRQGGEWFASSSGEPHFWTEGTPCSLYLQTKELIASKFNSYTRTEHQFN